jgi:N-methylhydantoinase A
MAGAARDTLASEGYSPERIALRWSADLRYLGQSFELTVPLPLRGDESVDGVTIDALVNAFGDAHERTYGHRAASESVELVNVRLLTRGVGRVPRSLPAAPALQSGPVVAASRSRLAYYGDPAGWVETPVIGRARLSHRPTAGPLIVEEYDATTLVPAGWSVSLGPAGAMLLEVLP